MALPSHFPTDPHAVLAPELRWYPGDDVLAEVAYENLLPPLVHKVRQGVKAWRDSGYAGASATTQALLGHWFQTEHLLPQADGTMARFQYYFAQREAVESVVWLYEIEQARDPYALLKYDSSGRVSKGMKQWCADATEKDVGGRTYQALFVRQEKWEQMKPKNFAGLKAAFNG